MLLNQHNGDVAPQDQMASHKMLNYEMWWLKKTHTHTHTHTHKFTAGVGLKFREMKDLRKCWQARPSKKCEEEGGRGGHC